MNAKEEEKDVHVEREEVPVHRVYHSVWPKWGVQKNIIAEVQGSVMKVLMIITLLICWGLCWWRRPRYLSTYISEWHILEVKGTL